MMETYFAKISDQVTSILVNSCQNYVNRLILYPSYSWPGPPNRLILYLSDSWPRSLNRLSIKPFAPEHRACGASETSKKGVPGFLECGIFEKSLILGLFGQILVRSWSDLGHEQCS